MTDSFDDAVTMIQTTPGRVICTGIGKSGLVARKVAATLASTGTLAAFLHPSEAAHGDLGMMGPYDVLLVFSKSGEATELRHVVNHADRVIAITTPGSTLAYAADVVLPLIEVAEPNDVGAPMVSTLLQMAIGDALAMALMEGRGFTSEDFRTLHPGGAMGRTP